MYQTLQDGAECIGGGVSRRPDLIIFPEKQQGIIETTSHFLSQNLIVMFNSLTIVNES